MGKRDDLIAKYAEDLKVGCGVEPDMALLKKVTIGCGPSIYDSEASTVTPGKPGELEAVKRTFLIRKLGLRDGPELMEAIHAAVDTYRTPERTRYRAVLYYLLTRRFCKEAAYG